jgi:Zn-dependent protease
MAQPRPGAYALRFELGGVPVAIQPSFWLGTILFGARLRGQALVLWVAVVLVSVLVHEFGHAIAYRVFGTEAAVELHAWGGLTFGDHVLARWKRIVVSLSGPAAGFVFGGMVMLVDRFVPLGDGWVPDFLVAQLLWVNFGWGFINLAPVLPLDGGHVMEELLGPRRAHWAPRISTVAAIGVAIWGGMRGSPYLALLFGWLALMSVQRWTRLPKRTPTASAAVTGAWVKEGWAALQKGWDVEAARLGTRALDAARTNAARAEALDLLAWTALAQGSPSHALSHLRQIPEGRRRALTWALALEADGKAAEALAQAERALEREPTDTSAAVLVRTLLALGKVEEAGRVVSGRSWSDAAAEARARGTVALAARDHHSAIHAFQQAFQRAGAAQDVLDAARAMVRDGQAERAAAWLSELAGRGVAVDDDAELQSALAPTTR